MFRPSTILGVARHKVTKDLNTATSIENQNQQNNSNDNNNNNQHHHHQSNATLSQQRISKSTTTTTTSRRPPLYPSDKNAMMRVPPNKPPLGNKPGNGNMPQQYDKQNPTTRPLMPTLAAVATTTTTKTSNRTPVTPRIAGSAPQSTTPLSRRTPRPELEGPTPVTSLLSNNITPRSGPRKCRVDSTNTTPTSTPTGSVPDLQRLADAQIYGLGINSTEREIPRRPTVSFSPAGSEASGARTPASNPDAKFFFASDAKTGPAPPRPSLAAKPASTFLYANGEPIPPPSQSSNVSASGSQAGEERAAPKFFHANGTPDLQLAASPHFPPPRPSSVVSSSSRMASPRLGTSSPGTLSPPQRPSSPSKLSQYASISSIQNTPSLPSPVLPRPPPLGRGNSANGLVSARRASLEAQKVIGRGRSSSGSSTPVLHARKVSGGVLSDISTPSTPLSVVTNSLPLSTPENTRDENSHDDSLPEIPSPIKAGHSIDKMNELAAEARRERKVLDLEITNSSLEAINRTLEREMRKVTAELRRYRRLSRSGRLSIGPSTSRAVSESLSIDDMGGAMLSDMSEEEEEEEEEESELSEDDSPDEGSLSPSAMAENDLKHRRRDEKRLQLDLTKHQEMLIDSQKMNQSLKRCLGWSESMILEGKKALEYKVRVTDVELGGRVLAPDEVEERNAELDNEGMSDIGARLLREAREKAAATTIVTWGNEGSDDRDSGIELRESGQSWDEEQ